MRAQSKRSTGGSLSRKRGTESGGADVCSRNTPDAAAGAALRWLRGRVQRCACCALSSGTRTAARALSGRARAAAQYAHHTHLLEVAARQLPIRARGRRGTGGVLRCAGNIFRRLDLKLGGGLHRLRGDSHEGHGVRHRRGDRGAWEGAQTRQPAREAAALFGGGARRAPPAEAGSGLRSGLGAAAVV